mmetsp:Transcript_3240/g.6829  ORF Transcript_3240/g.6829 Transcript_3240/m.6829 type:complete len:80 (-) Transcript_3240:544-783(-)
MPLPRSIELISDCSHEEIIDGVDSILHEDANSFSLSGTDSCRILINPSKSFSESVLCRFIFKLEERRACNTSDADAAAW